MERAVKLLVDFSARVLYHVLKNRISHDKAYQRVVKEYPKALRSIPPKILYRVSHDIVSDYYTIRFLEERVYGSHGGTKRVSKLWLAFRGLDKEYLQQYLGGVERLRRRLLKTLPKPIESVEELIDNVEDFRMKLAIKYSYPLWFVDRIIKLLGVVSAERLLSALNEEKWWIRVNTLKADVDTIVEKLEAKGVIVRRDPHLDYMLEVVDFSEPLHHLEEMWRGEIVFQDKASAMVVEALEPSEGDVILDAAAAPGVKDTLIMQLTENKAVIIAVDLSETRVKRMLRVLRMYGVDTAKVHVVNADSTSLQLRLKPSKAIVDAPCSSSGAIGKDPAIKLHLGDLNWVLRFPPLQREMLVNTLKYKPERTIYATCSILDLEGESNIVKLGLNLRKPRIPSAHGYAVYRKVASKTSRFFPHLHGTQGFFIALIEE